MKKRFSVFILISLIALAFSSNQAIAASPIQVFINGERQVYDQPPVSKDGRTLVPLRGIFETLGATVKWNPDTKAITATSKTTNVKLIIGSNKTVVNDMSKIIDVPAQVINNHTLVPLRFVSEVFGASVSWDAKGNRILITVDGPIYSGKIVNGIKVKYGAHTYGSQSQWQYNQVMQIVEKSHMKNYGKVEWPEEYDWYLSGDRAENYPYRSEKSRALHGANYRIGDLVKANVKKEEILKAHNAIYLTLSTYNNNAKDPGDMSPRSAYDELVRGVTDCDASAQVLSAVFDSLGYNTMIVSGNYHADPLVQINGIWYKPFGDGFYKYEIQKNFYKHEISIYSQPTNGTFIR
ncbi:MAG: copper amine oxidase N-terminal domain-containing protein [Bacillota bacterium]